jgi:hypothetical protein
MLLLPGIVETIDEPEMVLDSRATVEADSVTVADVTVAGGGATSDVAAGGGGAAEETGLQAAVSVTVTVTMEVTVSQRFSMPALLESTTDAVTVKQC